VPPQTAPPVVGTGLSDETVRAAKNLDKVIATLVDNFSEGSDYFKVLVNVFQSVLLTPDNDHLRTFFMIGAPLPPSLPPPPPFLTWHSPSNVSLLGGGFSPGQGVHVQSHSQCQPVRRRPSPPPSLSALTRLREMYFTDDGFAMGLSYCLAILKQTNKALSLHWFDTVNDKYKKDLAAHQEQQAARALKEKKKAENSKRKSSFMGGVFSSKKPVQEEDEEDQHQDFEEVHSLQLTAKRLEAMRRENDQLFYSMSGAAIFFKRTDVDI
jgi:WASH complex subunit 7